MPRPDNAGKLFQLFCRSQAAIAALQDRDRRPAIRGDIVR
jgi:hypothetical protein